MLKAILVDDDYLVRMYLRQLIDWEAENICLVADVCNGEEAMEVIQQEHPQIVITDLTMPLMDGIALIRWLKETGSTAKIAVLSCHDEFEYVKEAMKLGADEYVLKNVLNADSLRKLLDTLKKSVADSQEEVRQSERLQWLARRGHASLQWEAYTYLKKNPLELMEQQGFLQGHGIIGDFQQCVVMEIRLSQPDNTAVAAQVCIQYLRGRAAACAAGENGLLCLLLSFSDIISSQEQQAQLYQIAAELEENLLEYVNQRTSIAFSSVLMGDGNVTRAIAQAEEALQHTFYGAHLCDYSSLQPFAEALPEGMEELTTSTSAYDPELAAQALERCRTEQVRPERVLEWIAALDVLFPAGETLPEPLTFQDCVSRLETFRTIWKAQRSDRTLQTGNLSVATAAAYIREHFSNPLSLSDVAEEVQLNPAYLSHLFKKETGIGFSDYLLKCRTDYVCRRLRESRDSMKSIAADAGFTDYQNFCRLFKKQCGMRPADYRRKSQK